MRILDSHPRQPLSLADINALAALTYGVTTRELHSARRDQLLVRARWAAMWLAHELTPHSLSATGYALGRRDHTTILHGRRQAATLAAANDSAFSFLLLALRNALSEDTAMDNEPTTVTLQRITAALHDQRLSTLERLVLAELHYRARTQASVTLSLQDLSNALHVPVNRVLIALRDLTTLRVLDALLPSDAVETDARIDVQLRLGAEG